MLKGIQLKEMKKSNRFSRFFDANPIQAKQYRLPQIKWEIPSKLVLASNWYVVSGEESEEKAVQKLRESRVLEALYPHSSTIPPNPFFPADIEEQCHDDSKTPMIPIIPIEEREATTTSPAAQDDAATLAAVAAVSAVMKRMDPKCSIDTDLLTKILTDPTITTELMNKYRLAKTDNNNSVPSQSILGPVPARMKRDYGLSHNFLKTNNYHPATESILGPVPIAKDYNAKAAAVPMWKDMNYYKSLIRKHGADTNTRGHEPSPYRNILGGHLQNPEFSSIKYQKGCYYFNTPKGCRKGSRCPFQHEVHMRQRRNDNKRMKLGSGRELRERN